MDKPITDSFYHLEQVDVDDILIKLDDIYWHVLNLLRQKKARKPH